MRLQVSTRLAIFALIELAGTPDKQISVAEIGTKYGVSAHHLAKVMHTLVRANLVRSVRGVGGGYTFSGNLRRTTLLDIISLFEDISPGQDELDASTRLTTAGKAMKQVLVEIDENARATLESITLATMLKQMDRLEGGKMTQRAAVEA